MFPVKFRLLLMFFLVSSFLVQTYLVYTDENVHTEDNRLTEAGLRGRDLYLKNNCQSCHQIYGYGGILGPDLTNIARRLQGMALDNRLHQILTHGNLQMPAFNMTPEQIEDMKAYFLTLNETGTSQPSAYPKFYPNYEQYINDIHLETPLTEEEREGGYIAVSKCATCHKPFNQNGSGPHLFSAMKRLGEKEVREVIVHGRIKKGMPGMKDNNLTMKDVESTVAFLKWLETHELDLEKRADANRQAISGEPKDVPWFEYPDPTLDDEGNPLQPTKTRRRYEFYPDRSAQ